MEMGKIDASDPLSPEDAIDRSLQARGVPSPGGADWDQYCQLWRDVTDVTKSDSEALKRVWLFSQRKNFVDTLWRLGYRPPETVAS